MKVRTALRKAGWYAWTGIVVAAIWVVGLVTRPFYRNRKRDFEVDPRDRY